jgi:amidohydrolase
MEIDKTLTNSMIKWRRYLHQYPEVSFQEYKTSNWLIEKILSLNSFNIKQIGKTSFIAEINGSLPGNCETLAFRADIDALPVSEETGLPFSSKNDDVMHACGHDGHMAVLLGLAHFLVDNQSQYSGKIKLIFQAAEEIPPGGAYEIISSGAIQDVKKIFGIHIFPGHPVGHIGIHDGPITASQDVFRIHVKGKGTHGAEPEKGIDTILVTSEIINSVNHIISRNVSAFDSAVISIGQVHSGKVFNVIPSEAVIEGNIRTTNNEVRKVLKKRMLEVTKGIASSYGASANVEFTKGYDPVINDEKCTEIALEAAKEAVGGNNIFFRPQKMISEDFSEYTKVIKGCFLIVGGGEEQFGYTFMNHHPKFDFDERALLAALKVYIQIVLNQNGGR